MSEKSSFSNDRISLSPSTQIQRVLDFNDKNLMLIEFQPNYKTLTLFQCSIIGEFYIKVGGNKIALHDPTPLQYCVIENKKESLQGLFTFMRKYKHERYSKDSMDDYINILYNPTISNTPYTLIDLSIKVGNLDCLKLLVEEIQNFYPPNPDGTQTDVTHIVQDMLKKPDYNKKTPLTIAFENGQSDIASYLIGHGADPFYTNDDPQYKFSLFTIFENAPSNVQLFFTILQNSHLNCQDFKDKFVYNDNGHAIPVEQKTDEYHELKDFIDRKQSNSKHYLSAYDVFSQSIPNIQENSSKNMHANAPGENTDASSSSKGTSISQCCECQSSDNIQLCPTCNRYYCEEHMLSHQCS